MDIDEAKAFLKGVMDARFTDRTFHHYINNMLAGDFAVEIATVIRDQAKLAESRQENIKAMSGYLNDVAGALGVPIPTTPVEGVGACWKIMEAIRALKIAKENLESAIEVLICEEHRNVPDLHDRHQTLGGGCLFCLAESAVKGGK